MTRRKKKEATYDIPRGSRWQRLTWEHLNDWTGATTVTRGRAYQEQGRVRDLRISKQGELVAWVEGGAPYATRVRQEGGLRQAPALTSACSCPVSRDCKHAVAVVVELLDALEEEREVPIAEASDPRWTRAEGKAPPEPRSRRRSEVGDLRAPLRSRKKEQLVQLLLELCEQLPEVKRELEQRFLLEQGGAAVLVEQARRDLDALTDQDAWWDAWKGVGQTPDYSSLGEILRKLRDLGEHDAVIELGWELFEQGAEQVERAHDEGETGMEISACVSVAFDSIPKSSLSDPEKIRFALDMLLEDDYGLAGDAHRILDRRWSKRTWSTVADGLLRSLDEISAGVDFHSRFRRDLWSDAALDALDRAGRDEEALGLCEREAGLTGNYERLVSRLAMLERWDEAVDWAERGWRATEKNLSGSRSALRDQLTAIARKRRDWPRAAAYVAESFFEGPSVEALKELLAAARKAKCESEVREAALRYLESGRRPPHRAKRGAKATTWPLPGTGLVDEDEADGGAPEPRPDVLRDLAIDEGRAKDALHWHDRCSSSKGPRLRDDPDELEVARAVADEFPDRAVEIYLDAAERRIEAKRPKAYSEAGGLLRRVREILEKTGRGAEWKVLIAELREDHRRKPRLMEVLDGLEGKRVIAGRRRR